MYIWFDQGSGGDVDPNLNTYDEALQEEGQGTNAVTEVSWWIERGRPYYSDF